MENIVGVRVLDARRGDVGLLSWGRIGDAVDPAAFLERIRAILPDMGFRDVVDVTLCDDLSELRAYRYFYEGLVQFSAEYAEVLGGRKSLVDLGHSNEALRKSLYVVGRRRG